MRSAITLVVSLAALAALPITADARPLPEIPPTHCDPGPCYDPVYELSTCVTDGGGTACLPGEQRTAIRPPEPPPCDPAACPNPVQAAKGCLETASITTDPATGLPSVTCTLRLR
jgi:hypothetical protein